MFEQIDKINLFSAEMNALINTVNVAWEEIKYQPSDQFSNLLKDFIKSRMNAEQKLMEEIKGVLKFTNTIDNALSDYLFSKIQNEPEKIDEIDVTKLIGNLDGSKKWKINALWQSFFELRKVNECKLRESFTKIYQATYTIDRDTWNKFQGIENYLQKLKETKKTSMLELLTIKYEYSSMRDLMISRRNRQNILEKSPQWNKMKKDFAEKYNVTENKNKPVALRDTIQNNDDFIVTMETVLPKQELAKSDNMLQTILNSNNNMNIFLQRLNAIDFTINSFEKTEHFFEYHINHNKQTHEIDYTLYFDVCKVKYCLNETYNDEQYPFKIDTIRTDDYNFSDDYNVSDLTRYKIGQYTLKEEQYKDIFLSKVMKVPSFIECGLYYLGSFIKKEQIKRLLQSMYQINGGPDNIFIQLHEFETNNLSKGFAFANQKVIYFEEFIDNENQRSLKTIECNLASKINDEEKFNEIFNYSGGTSFYDPGWKSDWRKVKKNKLPNAAILKIKEGIFRDMENIDFTKNENFKIAKITYPIIMSIVGNMDVEKATLKKLKKIGSTKYKLAYGVQNGEYECMDGTVIKGKNIPTNRLKNENDQLQGAIAEFSFLSREESLSRDGELQEAIAESSLLEEQETDQSTDYSFIGEKMARL